MANIEINYLLETEINIETKEECNVAEEQPFEIIDKQEFIKRYNTTLSKQGLSAGKFWDSLLGHYPNTEGGNNPNVSYLTGESCEKIVEHYHLFRQGVDFQHLPSGFFKTKNPDQGGVRNVLHFSKEIAEHPLHISPLAIVLTEKPDVIDEEKKLNYPSPTSEWYQFLFEKIKGDGGAYCSIDEFNHAFIHFTNKIERLGLHYFEQPNFAHLPSDVNPIVLLGRWETVLTNKHLSPKDIQGQWELLPELTLDSSYHAIRAITDYEHTPRPCTLLTAEMNLFFLESHVDRTFDFSPSSSSSSSKVTSETKPEYCGLRTVRDYHDIELKFLKPNLLERFWRYLAFQPKRNSYSFYKDALKIVSKMNLYPDSEHHKAILQMLAGSTTGENYSAEDEEVELKIWEQVCDIMTNIESKTVILSGLAAIAGKGYIKSEFFLHISRLEHQPNIAMLKSICQEIDDFIGKLGPVDIARYTASFPVFQPLEDLSNRVNKLIKQFGTAFHQGTRFYLVNGEWRELGLNSYSEVATAFVNGLKNPFDSISLSLLSTFSIKTEKEANQLAGSIRTCRHKRHLKYALGLLKEIQVPFSYEESLSFVECFDNRTKTNYLSVLHSLKEKHAEKFKPDFFDIKEQELKDAEHGLNAAQIQLLDPFHFEEKERNSIISIESALLRKVGGLKNETLIALNEKFFSMNELLSKTDFSDFLMRLKEAREELPANPLILLELLDKLCKQKSTLNFTQFYLRFTLSQCQNGNFFQQLHCYLDNAPKIEEKKWNWDKISREEVFIDTLLKATDDDLSNPNLVGNLIDCLHQVDAIVVSQPVSSEYLRQMLVHLKDFSMLPKLAGTLININALFSEENSQDMLSFYSLIAHYVDAPEDLMAHYEKMAMLSVPQKKFLIDLICYYKDTGQNLDGLNAFATLMQQDKDEELQECIKPPLPPMTDLYSWIKTNQLLEKLKAFQKLPFGKRREDYAFQLEHFNRQKTQFEGVEDNFFTDELGKKINDLLTANRAKDFDALEKEVFQLRGSSFNQDEKLQLLCCCIEMLARTASQKEGNRLISQELNTTQVMALYAMLNQKSKKVLNQVDTGEGKSRIMMVLAGMNALMGKTVDFFTSDMQLAERDYFTYRQFFRGLGITSGLTTLNTPPQLYQKGGINITDNNQLLLLRNKSDIALNKYAYLEEDEEKRCLMIDEVDKFQHDKTPDAFNLAAKSAAQASFIWIYPLLVNFMEEKLTSKTGCEKFDDLVNESSNENKNDSAAEGEQLDDSLDEQNNEGENDLKAECGKFDSLVKEFQDYVRLHDMDEMHRATLAALHGKKPTQILRWLRSAYTALRLKEDHDYKVSGKTDKELFKVRDNEGFTRLSRKVFVLDNGRPALGSSFSEGVHQCLCAIQNKKAGKEEFVIAPESATQRSIYTTSFMDYYDCLYGVSGSIRHEAPTAKPELINYEGYHYLVTPREKPLRRDEKNVLGAKDEAQQAVFLKRLILQRVQNNQPVLLICRNDDQSQRLFDLLKKDRELAAAITHWQYVHALSSPEEEKEAIQQAGNGPTLTVSTVGMFGRGVDIYSEELLVLSAYVPSREDEIQIKGRTARFGRSGEYRLVVNLKDEDCVLNGNTYNLSNPVNWAQNKIAIEAVKQEEMAKLYAQFQEQVTQLFLTKLEAAEKNEHPVLLENWQEQLDTLQKDWNSKRETLIDHLVNNKENEFIDEFFAFSSQWIEKFNVQVDDDKEKKLAQTVYSAVNAHHSFFGPSRQPLKVQHGYDISDAGQARIYDSFFVQELAVLRGERPWFADFKAWREGRGALFPDLEATLRGERPLFATLRATISRLIEFIMNFFNDETVQEEGAREEAMQKDVALGA